MKMKQLIFIIERDEVSEIQSNISDKKRVFFSSFPFTPNEYTTNEI